MNDCKKKEEAKNTQPDENDDLDMTHFNRNNDKPVFVAPFIVLLPVLLRNS